MLPCVSAMSPAVTLPHHSPKVTLCSLSPPILGDPGSCSYVGGGWHVAPSESK